MRTVGLTGGIATGKSVASRYLESLGAEIIDADVIARQVVEPPSAALTQIAAVFGADMLSPSGDLDRRRLRELIFRDAKKREKLNAILHPAIRAKVEASLAASKAALAVIVAPLLLEAGYQEICDEIWLLYLPEGLQLERLVRRDGIDPALGRAMIDAQMPFEEKRRFATHVIENSGDPQAFYKENCGGFMKPRSQMEKMRKKRKIRNNRLRRRRRNLILRWIFAVVLPLPSLALSSILIRWRNGSIPDSSACRWKSMLLKMTLTIAWSMVLSKRKAIFRSTPFPAKAPSA